MSVKHYDFIIKGDEDKVAAYLTGYLRGKGVKSGFIFTSRHPFKSHLLKELLQYHGEVVHLICRAGLRSMIQAAVKQSPPDERWEIVQSRPVRRATFEFKFETANRKVAGAIKRLLGRHPAGVKLIDYEPKEQIIPDAKGSEGYAPLHEYTFEGKGTIVGDVEGVLKVHGKLHANEFIHSEEIDLVH
jgi:hypothetical protein